MTAYLPGSFFVVDVPGPGGFWIGVAQALVNDASRYKHAGLILDTAGTILEAEPGGARLANIAEYTGRGMVVCDGPVRDYLADWVKRFPGVTAPPDIRSIVAHRGRELAGTPYSWLDYAAIAALHLHVPSTALRRYVASSGHAQCAQLVDLAYQLAGVHLFTDGRQPGDVCPADLAAWAEDREAR